MKTTKLKFVNSSLSKCALLVSIISFSFLACQKKENNLMSESNASNLVSSNSAATAKKKCRVKTPKIACPQEIDKNGANNKSGNLKAQFTKSYPYAILVKGTTDLAYVKGNSGLWISNNKYASLQQTLTLLDATNSPACDCLYDTQGSLVNKDTLIKNFGITSSNNIVNVTWTSTNETGIAYYLVDRKLVGDVIFEEGVGAELLAGVGTVYNYQDYPAHASYVYRLRAVLGDDSTIILAEGSITF